MSDYAEFVNIITQLQSEDNDLRQRAETKYNNVAAQARVILLLQALNDSSRDSTFKSTCAVLCRRLFVDEFSEAFMSHTEEARAQILSQILLSISAETERAVRFKIADVAAAISNSIIDTAEEEHHAPWPEFVQYLTQCAQSEDASLRLIGLHLFAAVPNVFGSQTETNLSAIGQMLASCLSDRNVPDVRAEALKGLTAFLGVNGSENAVLAGLRDLMPLVMKIIMDGIHNDDEDENGLKCFCEIIDAAPKFVRPMLNDVLNMCFQILCNKELSDSTRQLSLTVIVLLAENLSAAVRKSGQFVEQLVNTLLGMMTEIEEEPDWEMADTLDEEDEEENAIVACRSLDAIAIAIGGKHIVNEIVRSVPIMLQNSDWKHRHAGLMAISYCGEGCRKQMDELLLSILRAVLPLLTDAHSRVRYAACYAVAQMSSDFSPKMQRLHHAIVLPALVATLDDACPRVQANAAAALINFIESLPKPILATYLEALVSKLEEGMSVQFQRMTNSGAKLVLTQIVDTVSVVAETAEDKFIPYYSRFMPGLKVIMESCATHKDLRELCGIVVQCISIIGLAVGKEVFRQDMEPILKLLLKAQASVEASTNGNDEKQTPADAAGTATNGNDFDSDDPQVTYMIRAWARICKLLGPDFEPYLPIVMPQLLATARIKPEICLVDSDDADGVRAEEDWEVVKFSNEEHLAVRTSGLEDKATACEMLVCYAHELKEKFAPYAQEVLDLMLPLLDFYLNEEVRLSAAEILPELLVCMRQSPEAVKAAWDRISTDLLKAIPKETDIDAEAEFLHSMSCCIDCLGTGCLTLEQLDSLHSEIKRLLEKHFSKDEERNQRRLDEDHDKENEEAILAEKDEDEKVLENLSELMRCLFITHREQALTIFNSILPDLDRLMKPDRPHLDLKWGLCFFCDLIEFGGELAWTHSGHYLQQIINSISHTMPGVRQVAVFSVGVMAQHGCPQFHVLLRDFIPGLLACIEAPESRLPDNNMCTENAISAITKIMKFHPNVLAEFGNMENLIARWFTWLPIFEDDSEADFVYTYLCDLIEQHNTALLGNSQEEQNATLARVIIAIAECYANEGITPDGPIDTLTSRPISQRGAASQPGKVMDNSHFAYYRCANLLKTIQTNAPLFEACISQLTEEQRSAIAKVLSA